MYIYREVIDFMHSGNVFRFERISNKVFAYNKD